MGFFLVLVKSFLKRIYLCCFCNTFFPFPFPFPIVLLAQHYAIRVWHAEDAEDAVSESVLLTTSTTWYHLLARRGWRLWADGNNGTSSPKCSYHQHCTGGV